MKIAMLSPSFPPTRCGVADHSLQLKTALEKMGNEVVVFKCLPNPERLAGIDTILLQYTPPLWTRRPYLPHLSLLRWCNREGKRRRILLLAHELHYPIHFSVRGLLYGVTQYLQFLLLKSRVAWTYFTYRAPQIRNSHQSTLLPVGSNIPVSSEGLMKESTPEIIRLAHFGGDHPTHLIDWTLSTVLHLQCKFPEKKVVLTWIGLGENDKKRILTRNACHFSPQDLDRLEASIVAPGYLPETAVSEELQRANLILAPFLDGVSTRRGSFMAALTHGCVIVTTRGWATDSSLPWDQFCHISEPRQKYFQDQVVKALNESDEERKNRGRAAREFYEKNFSWEQIARTLNEKILEGETG